MKVYGYPGTRSARAVWVLEEVSAQHDYQLVDLKKGEARQPPYLQLNAGGKVPAFVDGDLTLTESAAICIYVADKFPDAQLIPAATAERARCIQWCFFAMTELEQPLWTMAKHTFALPEKYRVPVIMDTAKWEFERAAKTLSVGLADNDYIVGGKFSIADLLLANILGWARDRQFQLAPDTLNAYADRMLTRPACKRAVEREQAHITK
jgi:glutathione S-transferase